MNCACTHTTPPTNQCGYHIEAERRAIQEALRHLQASYEALKQRYEQQRVLLDRQLADRTAPPPRSECPGYYVDDGVGL
jgi:hypothetical protein